MPAQGTAASRATMALVCAALASLAVVLVAGALGVLFYVPATARMLARAGLEFTVLRPMHTTFAAAWIFLGGIAVVYRYLQEHGLAATPVTRWRGRLQVLLWAGAWLGVLGTLAVGVTSGREYLGFHPVFAIPILLGWLLFAWHFFAATRRGFFSRPVYVTMWGVGIVFFIYTFVEQYAWLIPDIFAQPIVDLRLQWKATGTLVGAFNLFVYGTLYYVGEKLSGDEAYGHSKLAYALLAVGLLNSFTNFGHHTYHVPQSELVKWISFVISMTEVLILARVVWDVARMAARHRAGSSDMARFFLTAAKWWIIAIFLTAMLISVPPWNSLIHGTHVVTAHAMGAEIGIDSMILFAAISWMLSEFTFTAGPGPGTRRLAVALNVAVAAMVVWLNVSGAFVGYARYQHLPPPGWLDAAGPVVFAATGLIAGGLMALLLLGFARQALRGLVR